MATVYTRRIVGVRQPMGSGAISLYTHTAPNVCVLRSIMITNTQGSAGYLDLYIASSTGNLFLWRERSFPAETTRVLDVRQELETGETIALYRENIDVSVLITAYVFSS